MICGQPVPSPGILLEMFLTNKTQIKSPVSSLSAPLADLQQLLGRGDLGPPAGRGGGPADDAPEELSEGLHVVLVGEAVDERVEEGGGPGEDDGDHVEPAEARGREGVEDSEDCPGEETEEEGDVDERKCYCQTPFSFLGLSGDSMWSINFQ